MRIQNLIKIHPLVLKILNRNEILISPKGQSPTESLQFFPHLLLPNIYVYAKIKKIS